MDLESILVLQMLTFVASSVSLIAAIIARKDRGLGLWVRGLLLSATALGLTVFGHIVPEDLWIPIIGISLCGSYSLLLAATMEFRGWAINKKLLISPVIAVVIISALTNDNGSLRLLLNNTIYLSQNIAVVMILVLSGDGSVAGRGKFLVVIGAIVQALVYGARAMFGFKHQMIPYHVLDQSQLQIATVITLQFTTIIISFGFLIMVIEASENEINKLRRTDTITGIWNRVMADETLVKVAHDLKFYGVVYSLIMIDLDNFKDVNDKHGHTIGDLILREFSVANMAAIRQADVMCRWGGEEFIVILPDTSAGEAENVAKRLMNATRKSTFSHGISLTASYGVTSCAASEDWTECVQRADRAMYLAKSSGRNQVVGLP